MQLSMLLTIAMSIIVHVSALGVPVPVEQRVVPRGMESRSKCPWNQEYSPTLGVSLLSCDLLNIS